MSHSVQMPALGESVTEGTVTRWLKSEGESVEVDEPLLEVSTDKVDTEIPSPVRRRAREDPGRRGRNRRRRRRSRDHRRRLRARQRRRGRTGCRRAGARSREAAPAAEAAPAEAPSTEAEAPAEKPTAGTASAAGPAPSVTLPEMGESVTEGTVTRWLKAVGDDVALDEPLVEVSTDKVDTEIPSPVAGTLLEITVGEDETIEVGAQLGVIGDASAAPAPAPEAGSPSPSRLRQLHPPRPLRLPAAARPGSCACSAAGGTQARRSGHPVGPGPGGHLRHPGDPQARR